MNGLSLSVLGRKGVLGRVAWGAARGARRTAARLGACALLLPLLTAPPAEAQEQRKPSRTLPRLTLKESAKRRTQYRPPSLSETQAPAPDAAPDAPGLEEEAARAVEQQGTTPVFGSRRRRQLWVEESPRPALQEAPRGMTPEARPPDAVQLSQGTAPSQPAWTGGPRTGTEAAIALALREARSDVALARALGSILGSSELPEERERQAFLEAVSRLQSPGARGRLLVGVLQRARITPETARTLLGVARDTQDDTAISRVLAKAHRIQETDVMHGPLMPELLRTVEALRSPAARGLALRDLLSEAPISVDTGCEVLRMTGGLGDDREVASVLDLMHRIRERDLVMDPLAVDYVEATRGLQSSAERARALAALLKRGPLPREAVVRALHLGRGLALEQERRELAEAVAPLNARSADVRQAMDALFRPLPEGTAVPQVASSEASGSAEDTEARAEREELAVRTEPQAGEAPPADRHTQDGWVLIEPDDPGASEGMAHVSGAAEAEESETVQHAGVPPPDRVVAERQDAPGDVDAASLQVREHARALIRAEEQAFEEARKNLHESAVRLRDKADRVARQMREEVDEMRRRVRRELQAAGVPDSEEDPTADTGSAYGMGGN